MKYIILSATFILFVGCGNQHEGEGQLRLVGTAKNQSIVTPISKESSNLIFAQEENRTNNKSENILLAELSAQSKWELMKLEAQHEKELKELEKEVALAKLHHQKEMESSKLANQKEMTLATLENNKEMVLAQDEMRVKTQDKDHALYEMIALITAGVLILFLFVFFLMHRRTKNIEIQLHHDELRHKEMMEAKRQHHENIRKILEIIADEKSDKGIKEEMVLLLKDQKILIKENLLIEYK